MKNRLWFGGAVLLMAISPVAEAQSILRRTDANAASPIGAVGVCSDLDKWVGCAPTVGLVVRDAKGETIKFDGWDPLSVLEQDGKNFMIRNYSFANDVFGITLTLMSNPDPFVQYIVGGVNNTNGPLSFLFTFTSPYIGGAYSSLRSTHSSSHTEGNGKTVTPDASETHIHRPFVDGLDVVGAFIAPSCVMAISGSGVCNYATITLPYVTAASGSFGVDVGWTMPADAQFALWSANGRVTLMDPVPEPSTVLLFAAGLFVMGLVVFQRRRTV